jgi:prefoldin subunit 5
MDKKSFLETLEQGEQELIDSLGKLNNQLASLQQEQSRLIQAIARQEGAIAGIKKLMEMEEEELVVEEAE